MVRFNLYRIEGFEADVGTRTSYWFLNRPEPKWFQDAFLTRMVERVYLHVWGDEEAAARDYRYMLAQLGRHTEIVPVPKEILRAMDERLGEPYWAWSTGAIGVWMMLQEHSHVTLTGFDWWEPGHPFHYSDQQTFQTFPVGHLPHLEKRFFESLAAEGRLHFL